VACCGAPTAAFTWPTKTFRGGTRTARFAATTTAKSGTATAHYIRYSQLYEIVLRKVRDVAEAAQAHQADLEQFAKAIYGDHQAMSTQKEQRELRGPQQLRQRGVAVLADDKSVLNQVLR
jgi:hypothetical protein